MTGTISTHGWQKAAGFIANHGTNLQRELFDFHFNGGSQANVLAALSHYRNADGGFGHGLEADLRTRQSSVVATTVALQIIDEVGAMNHPLARDAVAYLAVNYTGGNWPLVSESCNDAPHAPWWHYDPDWASRKAFLPNPAVEVLSYLISCCAMGETTRLELWQRSLDWITDNPLEMHELLCYLRLYDNPKLPADHKRQLLPLILAQAYQLVKVAPADWEEYVLMPMSVVPHPDSPLMAFFGDLLDENFAWQLLRQSEDGSWSPSWSWGNAWPGAWRLAEVEIKATLTLRFLIQLQRFGRLPQPHVVRLARG